MARPKSTGETKSHQQHLLMAKSEVAEVDEWMFANHIRSRGDAIRRLCKIGIATEQSFSKIEGELRAIYFVLENADEAFHKENSESDADRISAYLAKTREVGDRLWKLVSGVAILSASFVPLRQDGKTQEAVKDSERIVDSFDYLNAITAIKIGLLDPSSARSRELGRQAARRFLHFPVGGLADNPFPETDIRHALFIAGYEEVIAGVEKLPPWMDRSE